MEQQLAKQNKESSGTAMVVIAALLFACKGTLIKYIYSLGAGVADVMILRLLFSMPAYLWVALRHWPAKHNRPKISQWIGVMLCGICGYYIASYFDMLGLQTISAGLERIILYTFPAFVVIFSAWLFKKSLSPLLYFYIAVSYVGLFMVFYADIRVQPASSTAAIIQGSLYVLISAIAFAGYVIGSEHFMRSMSSAIFTAVAMLAAGIVMSLHYALFNSPAHLLQLSSAVYGWCLLTAIAFTVMPAFMMSAGIRKIGSAKAGGIGMVGPLATLVIAASVLGETITLLQIAGFIVVVFAIQRVHKI
ncbi:MAG: permease [Verrucomicrobiaceae bacterium]|nr:permease [Verrucomicrobiaceae bacterium]